MNSRNRDIIWYFNINVFFPSNVYPIFLLESYKLEYFTVFLCFFLHYLKHYIRLLGLWNVNCIKLLIVQINTIFVVCFAHFTEEGFPVDCDTEVVDRRLDLFWKPCFQAQKVNILDSSWALARSDEWVGGESRLETYSANIFVVIF